MPQRCERARAAVSLELDDELSPLERAFLQRHLARCVRCRDFRLSCMGFTSTLRTAPLERVPVSASPDVRPRAPRRRVVQRAAAAFASVATLAFASLYGAANVDNVTSHESPSTVRPAYLESTDFELGLLRPARATRGTENSVPL